MLLHDTIRAANATRSIGIENDILRPCVFILQEYKVSKKIANFAENIVGMEPIPQLSETYFITPGLCNTRRELPVPLLVSNIIETATKHANMLGIGFKSMTPKGIGWVLSRLTLQMDRYPSFNEHYVLSTWVESWNRHFSVRDFQIATPEGEVLGYARTVWMVIDLESHANVGTTGLDFDNSLISADRVCPIPLQKKHRSDIAPSRTTEYTFRYTDIDFYGHVNTVRYVELLLNQFSLSKYEKSHVHRLEMAFQHEARYGQDIRIDISGTDAEGFSLILSDKASGTPLLNSRIVFS